MASFGYSIRISSKAKRYHLEVDWHKGLVVVVPKRWNQLTVERLVGDKQYWIQKQLKRVAKEKRIETSDIVHNSQLKVNQVRNLFKLEVDYWSKTMNLKYSRIFLRRQKTKWGSCSQDGNLNLNWQLAYSPAGVREYVIIHELVHIRHMNHGAAFWKEVEKYCPDYKIPKKWLKENGRILTHLIKSARD